MSEADLIKNTTTPPTRQDLARALHQLGVEAGMTLLVHISLRALGWIVGGHVALIQALMDVLTSRGTLVMPTHSGDLSDPSLWENPPVPKSWWPVIREHWPAYDPLITPTRALGRTVEAFRSWPGVLRSEHPAMSFSAWGASAKIITGSHELENSLGEGSPLARIYDLEGWVLLLGCGYDSNTSFHLSEYRVPDAKQIQQGVPIFVNGKQTWQTYSDIDLDSDLFPDIGIAFEKAGHCRIGNVGMAKSRLFRQKQGVDFAETWIREHRRKQAV